ncbi:MAG: ribonuclease P protein subunit [Thermoprotei archaeon]|nr:MAG: ribonuclease P protein subunit [Thermoprotei archaeon]
MKITPRNIVFHELIGLKVAVEFSNNVFQIGITGKIVNETAKTFVIETCSGRKIIPKKGVIFLIELPSGERIRVKGDILLGRPEERLKRKIKYW